MNRNATAKSNPNIQSNVRPLQSMRVYFPLFVGFKNFRTESVLPPSKRPRAPLRALCIRSDRRRNSCGPLIYKNASMNINHTACRGGSATPLGYEFIISEESILWRRSIVGIQYPIKFCFISARTLVAGRDAEFEGAPTRKQHDYQRHPGKTNPVKSIHRSRNDDRFSANHSALLQSQRHNDHDNPTETRRVITG